MLLMLLWLPLVDPKTRNQVLVCTLMQYFAQGNRAAVVMINLLDLYTVQSSALHG